MSKYLLAFWLFILLPPAILAPVGYLIDNLWIVLIGALGLPMAWIMNEKEYDKKIKDIERKYE